MPKRVLKWSGAGVGGLLALVLVLVAGAFAFTNSHRGLVYEVDPPSLQTTNELDDAEVLALGERLYLVRGCADCHARDLGGSIMVDDRVVGRLTATNLTTGAGGAVHEYSQEDWIRAIRHGVGRDGRPLIFMPSHEFFPIGDDDLAAMIAYMESVPPVDRELPPTRLGPLAAILYSAGKMPLLPARLIDHSAPRPTPPPPGPTAEYGAYLATGCIGCHGDNHSGGRIPGAPPDMPIPTNITPDPETGIGTWTQEDFVRLMREGIRPNGEPVDPFMPVAFMKEFTDMELEAMWLYLRTLEPRPFGRR